MGISIPRVKLIMVIALSEVHDAGGVMNDAKAQGNKSINTAAGNA
jgi:hypothetical protein